MKNQGILFLTISAFVLALALSFASFGTAKAFGCGGCWTGDPDDDIMVCRAYAGGAAASWSVDEDQVKGQVFIWESVRFQIEGYHTGILPSEMGRPAYEKWIVVIETPWGEVVQRYQGNPVYVSWDRTVSQSDGSYIVATIGEYRATIYSENEEGDRKSCDSDWGPWNQWRFVVPVPNTNDQEYRDPYGDGSFPYDLLDGFVEEYNLSLAAK